MACLDCYCSYGTRDNVVCVGVCGWSFSGGLCLPAVGLTRLSYHYFSKESINPRLKKCPPPLTNRP